MTIDSGLASDPIINRQGTSGDMSPDRLLRLLVSALQPCEEFYGIGFLVKHRQRERITPLSVRFKLSLWILDSNRQKIPTISYVFENKPKTYFIIDRRSIGRWTVLELPKFVFVLEFHRNPVGYLVTRLVYRTLQPTPTGSS